jgi:YesN/AraC family two-component response regulator
MSNSLLDEFVDLLLQHLQNVSQNVAIQALDSIQDDFKHNLCSQLFEEWRITEILLLIRMINTINAEHMQSLISKHMRDLEHHTSYDLMMSGCLERYKYHPITALRLFKESIQRNPLNYETRMYMANTLDSEALNRRLECSHELELSMNLCQYVIDRLTYCMQTLNIDHKLLETTMNEHQSFLYLLK